jgi:hypothetical protein
LDYRDTRAVLSWWLNLFLVLREKKTDNAFRLLFASRTFLRSSSDVGTAWCAFAKADAGTSPVLVDEFDAGGFQSAANCQVIWQSHPCPTFLQLSSSNRCDAYGRGFGQIFGPPPN